MTQLWVYLSTSFKLSLMQITEASFMSLLNIEKNCIITITSKIGIKNWQNQTCMHIFNWCLPGTSIQTAMALDKYYGMNGRASTDKLNTNRIDSRHCTERNQRQSHLLNLDTMLSHHSTVPGFICFGSWGWKLKRRTYRKIRWLYLGVKRKKWNKVRTEPLSHCIRLKK